MRDMASCWRQHRSLVHTTATAQQSAQTAIWAFPTSPSGTEAQTHTTINLCLASDNRSGQHRMPGLGGYRCEDPRTKLKASAAGKPKRTVAGWKQQAHDKREGPHLHVRRKAIIIFANASTVSVTYIYGGSLRSVLNAQANLENLQYVPALIHVATN